MKKDLKYILFLVGVVITYLVIEISSPKPINWTITFSNRDKNPFGSYLINERLTDIFPPDSISNVNLTLYELEDSAAQNILILANSFFGSKEDTDVLLEKINKGMNAFIAADYFSGQFADTLNLETTDYFFQEDILENITEEDTAFLRFVNPRLQNKEYYFRRNNTQNFFSSFDTLRTEILVTNDLDKPQMIRVKWGQGSIYLSSTPLAFTNNYLLLEKNHEFVSTALSYLPPRSTIWTEYYQLGRMEAQTPLRFILTNESLSWAYYIAILTLVLFIFFEAKRKQRVIPIITPLTNTTLEFVGTIANLYFYKKDHKSIALKRINFFQERLRTKYRLQFREDDSSFIERVAHKTSHTQEEIKSAFDLIKKTKQSSEISEEQLKDLSKTIDEIL
ncbi:MAG: DUF4350 domain-containing protein [Bacteroidota bacterium]